MRMYTVNLTIESDKGEALLTIDLQADGVIEALADAYDIIARSETVVGCIVSTKQSGGGR